MDDVPLICDPVPGGVLVVIHDATVTRRGQVVSESVRYLFCQRTEWPDAEFCAA